MKTSSASSTAPSSPLSAVPLRLSCSFVLPLVNRVNTLVLVCTGGNADGEPSLHTPAGFPRSHFPKLARPSPRLSRIRERGFCSQNLCYTRCRRIQYVKKDSNSNNSNEPGPAKSRSFYLSPPLSRTGCGTQSSRSSAHTPGTATRPTEASRRPSVRPKQRRRQSCSRCSGGYQRPVSHRG